MLIDQYDIGEITIEGERYQRDLIICPDKIYNNWRRQNPNQLNINDLQLIIPQRPAKLVVGLGQSRTMQINAFTREKLNDLGFEIYTARTRAAVDYYNKVCKKEKTIGIFCIE